MITLRKGHSMACLALLLSGCALAGLGQTARADADSTPAKGLNFVAPSAPVMKIDRAMLEERETLSDGTVHLETFFGASPVQSAKSAPKKTTAAVTVKV